VQYKDNMGECVGSEFLDEKINLEIESVWAKESGNVLLVRKSSSAIQETIDMKELTPNTDVFESIDLSKRTVRRISDFVFPICLKLIS